MPNIRHTNTRSQTIHTTHTHTHQGTRHTVTYATRRPLARHAPKRSTSPRRSFPLPLPPSRTRPAKPAMRVARAVTNRPAVCHKQQHKKRVLPPRIDPDNHRDDPFRPSLSLDRMIRMRLLPVPLMPDAFVWLLLRLSHALTSLTSTYSS